MYFVRFDFLSSLVLTIVGVYHLALITEMDLFLMHHFIFLCKKNDKCFASLFKGQHLK